MGKVLVTSLEPMMPWQLHPSSYPPQGWDEGRHGAGWGARSRMEGLPSKWSKLGLSARQFARRIGVTYSMAEFVVYGHQHPPCQPKASKSKTTKDHKDIVQVTSLKSAHMVPSKVRSSQRYRRAMTRSRAGLKRYRQTQPRIKLSKHGQARKKSKIAIMCKGKLSASTCEAKSDKGLKSPSYTKPSTKLRYKKWSVTNMPPRGKSPSSRRRYVRKHTHNPVVWKRWCRNISKKLESGRVPLQNIRARRQRKSKTRKVHSAVQVPSIVIREESTLPLPIECLEFSQEQGEHNNLSPGTQDRMTQMTATEFNQETEASEEAFQESEEKKPADDEWIEGEGEGEGEEEEEEEEESVSYGWWELFRSWLLSLETYFRI